MSEQYRQENDAAPDREPYRADDQPGMHPANRPGNTPEGERDPHKSNYDLEDVTGNPGHRNSNPNIPPATMGEILERAAAGPVSINEPPGREFAAEAIEVAPAAVLPPGEGPLSINEPPGSEVVPPPEEPPPPEQPPPEVQPTEQQQYAQPQFAQRPY
jgi:hypothetical protein